RVRDGTVAAIDGRAAGEELVGERLAAVVAQRAEERIDAEEVGRDEAGGAVGVADDVMAQAYEEAGQIEIGRTRITEDNGVAQGDDDEAGIFNAAAHAHDHGIAGDGGIIDRSRTSAGQPAAAASEKAQGGVATDRAVVDHERTRVEAEQGSTGYGG